MNSETTQTTNNSDYRFKQLKLEDSSESTDQVVIDEVE
jgi:hypothetical protein